MISRIFCHQSKCFAARPSPCFDTMPHIVACLCNHRVLYVITFTPFFISSPECAHLSPSICNLLFMFLHIILCCPSPYCIPHAIIKCQMTILISYFPCLAARFLPRGDCSICPLAPLFAYLRIWDSLIYKIEECQLPHSLVLLDALSLWPRRLLSLLQSSFVVSRWLLPEYPRQVPPPTLPFHLHQSRATYWLPSTITGRHTNTATAPLSACHEAPVKTLPIQADLSGSPLPHVPLCTAAFSFCSQVIISHINSWTCWPNYDY